MIATLPMYDRPELRAATDALWGEIRTALGRGPEALDREIDMWEAWQSPDLLLAQTCGMPFRTRLYGKVQLVATPDYGLPGCPAGHYNSVIIARKDRVGNDLKTFAGQRFAYNEALSQSGWAAPMMHMRPHDMLPGELVETGGHRNSAAAVAEDRADFAAIDALTWQLLCDYEPLTEGLVEIERTEPTPALPYITAKTEDGAALFAAMETALGALSAEHRNALHLRGVVRLEPSAYLAIPTPPGPTLVQDRLARA
ncbi:phosphate/phosphite/phosphonate ABC transporters, periplasmic binding protein [Tritonibacter multivorans]|uniref:Phosphate/phosphite/phosphonate ABC transporters, periplasmic binding protein n=1 Tax=Tritonibacter multivorans TaxID=928856 RepID=A0A0P1GHN2_9RHOB|nr:PhnD/SsuA/transferrin family substrate-binding protein [Tritonibacter multivorans]MDA7420632.1 PhnD/SsuA/transferrin family substrate-binding protein [Tritonibacter multivorans]CUH81234.1 phosphate/phosphite/phosphonate ABC transporters, periplasmic binding protein [Tritonibacter multivorans]SFC31367.1 ABC transporter, phosphonate, substrate-binding protein [Tritonibacter multivorans]